jgi:glycosyltransferase involved in cell wall biosynthesis
VNEPIGVLRLVDPFRAGEAWLSVAAPGYRVRVEQVAWPARAADVARIAALAAADGARIIHAHGRWANLIAVPAARSVRAKVVCTRGPGASLAESMAMRAADAVMCFSQEDRDRSVRRDRIPATKVCLVHPGVDLGQLPARAPDAPPLVLAVGSLFARHGHLNLLDAVARARADVPDLAVLCAGEGPMRPVLEQRIAYLGLRQCVELLGHIADVPALMARSHVAWTPGLRSTIEAMAAGVPVLSPWRELIGAEMALQPQVDVAGLTERLVAALKAGPKAGAPLRKRAEQEFSLEAFRTRLRALYDALLVPERAAA